MPRSADPKDVQRWRGKLAENFESKSELLIPILQYIQAEESYLPPDAMEAAARFLRLPTSKVYGVASFYAQFNFSPQGKNKLTVCRGTACHVRGSGPLLKEVERELGVSPGETTEDMSFTLETVACFGACALAPVVVLNEKVLRKQTANTLKRLVQQTRQEAESTESEDEPTDEEKPKLGLTPPAKRSDLTASCKRT